MDFINKKSLGEKRKSIKMLLPALLGVMFLVGNIVSIPGFTLDQKSYAQSNNRHHVFNLGNNQNQNPNKGFTGSTFGNNQNRGTSNSAFNSNPNFGGQSQNSNPVSSALNNGLRAIGIDSSTLGVPFSGSQSFSNVIPTSFSGGINHESSLCSTIKGTAFANLNSTYCDPKHVVWDPTYTFTKALTNDKTLTTSHTHSRFHVVGPDNFKFINSYWTTSEVTRAIDVGTSANTTYLGAASHISNVPIETDNGYGPVTLAVELQYEGVVQLTGITAALKLPPGFVSNLPLIHNHNRYDISFSNYRGHIYPGQGIVLYFPVTIIGNPGVRVPYQMPLAIHFLREDKQFDTHSLSANDQDQFANSLAIKNGTSTATFNSNTALSRTFGAVDEGVHPFDFVNQVLPIEFAITGQEIFSVLIGAGPDAAIPLTPILALLPPGVPTPVKVLVKNTGDAPIYNLNIAPSVRDESSIAATVVPSSVAIPNVVQQNALEPLVLIGPQSKQFGYLPVNGTAEITITPVPSFYAGGTVEPIFITLAYNNQVGLPTSVVKRIGVEILPVSAQTALQNAITAPHAVSDNVISLPNTISNRALHALSNDIGSQSLRSVPLVTHPGDASSGSSHGDTHAGSGSGGARGR